MIRRIVSAAVAWALAACAGPAAPVGVPASVPIPSPPATTGALESGEPRPAVPQEAWRIELLGDASLRAVVALPRGAIGVAGTFRERLTLGDRSVSSQGNEDVFVATLARTGEVLAARSIGGPGDDGVGDLAPTAEGAVLALEVEESRGVVGLDLPRGADGTGPTAWLAHLDGEGAPRRAVKRAPGARETRVRELPGGDLVVATSRTGESDLFGEATVERVSPEGTLRWTVRLDRTEVNALTAAPSSLWLSLRASGKLSLLEIDPATGVARSRHDVEKPPSAGDLGGISEVVVLGHRVVAFGETGGAVRVAGREHARATSYALQPMILELDPTGSLALQDAADVTGTFAGTGVVDGLAAGALWILHTGRRPEPHRGLYVALAAQGAREAPRLWPISQVRYEMDDWERSPREVLRGKPFSPRQATFAGSDLYLVGGCDDGTNSQCIARVRLPHAR